MVQDLAFGEKCETKSSMGGLTTMGNITTSGTYYGDCYKANLPSSVYAYNTTAAMNYGVTPANYTCSGTQSGTASGRPATCAGICPANWHIPTRDEWSDMHTALVASPLCTVSLCWFEPDVLNIPKLDLTHYGYETANYMTSSNVLRGFGLDGKTNSFWSLEAAMYVRCVRNYY
jgi:uncharacterized protein (TIGR02145 family)